MTKKVKTDMNARLKWLLRGRMISGIKKQLGSKAYKTIELIGCPIDFARRYLEKQFRDDMCWENHGYYWEIDHIIPVSSFDLTVDKQQKMAFHYTNLQPLLKYKNRNKGSRIV